MVPFVSSGRTAPLESPGFLRTRSRILLRINFQICVAHFAFPRIRYAFEVRSRQYPPRRDRVWKLFGESHGGHDRLGEKACSRTDPQVVDRRSVLLNKQGARGASAVHEADVEARHGGNKRRLGIRAATENRRNRFLHRIKRNLLNIKRAFP